MAQALLHPESSEDSKSSMSKTSISSSDKPMTPPEGLEPSLPSNADVIAYQTIFNARHLDGAEEKRVVDSQLSLLSSNARVGSQRKMDRKG